MGAASAWVRIAPRITRHLAFVIPAAAERRSPPDAAGRGAFGNIIGEPTTDHAAPYYKFESISLQRRVRCEPVSGGNSPSYVEKPRFSAGVRAGASAAVGRDVPDAATSGRRAVISLSGDIPVPHRR